MSARYVNFFCSAQRQERQNNNIAILHPQKLVIYSLVTSYGLAEHGKKIFMAPRGIAPTYWLTKIDINYFPVNTTFRSAVKVANFAAARPAEARVHVLQRQLRWSERQRIHMRDVCRRIAEILRTGWYQSELRAPRQPRHPH